MTKDKDVDDGITAGYLEVKVPAHSKRRRFGTWKSWRRHWVVARRSGQTNKTGEIELVLSSTRLSKGSMILKIPAGSTVCRTTSRSRNFAFVAALKDNMEVAVGGTSQSAIVYLSGRSETETEQWIVALRSLLDGGHVRVPGGRVRVPDQDDILHRQVDVWVLDSPWARQSGVAGLRGVLVATPTNGVVFKDVIDQRVRLTLSWSCVESARMASEDVVLIAMNSSSLVGSGQLRLRCSTASAPVLARLLGDQRRARDFICPALLRGRRLSRSEGDLLASDDLPVIIDPLECDTVVGRGRVTEPSSTLTLSPLRLLRRRRAETLRAQSPTTLYQHSRKEQNNNSCRTSNEKTIELWGEIASGLISAGLGLMLSTPGSSEVEDNEEDDEEEHSCEESFDRRRESAVSAASGIYEEISDLPDRTENYCERLYENSVIASRRLSHAEEGHYEDPVFLSSPLRLHRCNPPPLPPRQNASTSKFNPLEEGDYVPMAPLHSSSCPRLITEPRQTIDGIQ